MEVKERLYSFGLMPAEVNEIIASLITENYLNEERFAIQFAGGKFRMKQWGRYKIKQALQQKQISDYCIRKALKEIDEKEYERTFQKLVQQRLDALQGEKNIFTKKRKLQDFLLNRGFESSLVSGAVKGI